MNVASLDLCKELYELSRWDSDGLDTPYDVSPTGDVSRSDMGGDDYEIIPAYDLGYLQRKLAHTHPYPKEITDSRIVEIWLAEYPEDAACKLAIELFKQGVLK